MTAYELQDIRRILRLTQQELAHRLGIARNTIARYEMGGWAIPITITLAIRSLTADARPLRSRD